MRRPVRQLISVHFRGRGFDHHRYEHAYDHRCIERHFGGDNDQRPQQCNGFGRFHGYEHGNGQYAVNVVVLSPSND